MPSVGLILLAAGGSRRLGTPKQLERDGAGVSLVRHAARTALASTCRPVVAVLGASAEAVRREIEDLPLTIALNPDWESGMASSLRAGLAALTANASPEAVIVMLCDQPFVTPTLLDLLVAASQTSGPDIVACDYGEVVGVPALFRRALFGTLSALQGDEGARHIIRRHSGSLTRIPFPEGRLDIDTRQDMEAFRKAASGP